MQWVISKVFFVKLYIIKFKYVVEASRLHCPFVSIGQVSP